MSQVVEAAAPEQRDSFTQRATDWVFGYDYFISYSHRDGKNYPRFLKDRLERAGFRVFLDQTDYAPGTNLSRETRRQVLKSKVIVVVGREGALASTWVKREVDIALAHHRDPVVIDINDAMARAQLGVGIADTVRREHWLRLIETVDKVPNEAGVLVDDGDPTDKAVGELIRSFRHTRQQRVRYRMLAGVAGILGVLAIVAGQQAVVATFAKQRAESERVKAEITNELLIARKAVALAEAGDGTAATQLALESAMALRNRSDHPDAKAASDEAYRALHTAHYARRELAVMTGDKSRGTAIAFAADGNAIAIGKRSGAFEIHTRQGALITRGTHTTEIASLAFSPDGTRLLTASRDGTARQWNAATGERIGSPLRHEGGVNRAVYGRDGTIIATAGADNQAALWSAGDGRLLHRLAGHARPVFDARFSPDGNSVATASEDGTVRLWRTADGTPEITQDGSVKPAGKERHENPLRTVAFSPNGRFLVSAGKDHYAVVWDLQAGTSRRLRGHEDTLYGAIFNPRSSVVLTYSEDFTARLWAADTGAFVARLQHDSWVQSGEFSPDGSEVLTASKENATRIWVSDTGELKAVLAGHDTSEKFGQLAAYDPKGEIVATTSWDGTSRLWTAAAGVDIKVIKTGRDEVLTAAFSVDGMLIGTGSSSNPTTGILNVWDSATGARLVGPVGTQGRNWRVAFHPDGRTMAASAGRNRQTGESTVVLLDLASKHTKILVHSPSVTSAEPMRSVDYSADGKRLVSAGYDGKARVWDAASYTPIGDPIDHGGQIQIAVLDVTGASLATAGQNGQIKLWNLAGRSPRILKHGTNRIHNLAFTRNESRLLATYSNGEIGFWELSADPPHFNSVARLGYEAWAGALSADEKRVIVGDLGRRGAAAVIDAATEYRIAELKGQLGGIRAASFAPDGRRVLTASNDGTVWIWPLFAAGDQLIAHAGARLPRCLSRKERTALALPAAPPDWCITGWGQENETDPAKWKPKWPYDTPNWRQWHSDVRTNPDAPLPD